MLVYKTRVFVLKSETDAMKFILLYFAVLQTALIYFFTACLKGTEVNQIHLMVMLFHRSGLLFYKSRLLFQKSKNDLLHFNVNGIDLSKRACTHIRTYRRFGIR